MRLRMVLFVTVLAFALSPQGALAFEGKYSNSKSGYNHDATITRAPDGSYKVNVSVATRGCLGDFDGIGMIEGKDLVVRSTDKSDTCRLTISQGLNGLSIKEDRCLMWHGVSCEFTSTLQKKR